MKDVDSVQRLWLLIRNDAIRNFRTVVTVSTLFVGLVLINNLILPGIASVRENYYFAWFAVMLFLWGIPATSRAFRDLHDKTRNEAYLLIPASILEKTLARLLSHTVGFVVFLLALTFVLSLAVEAVNAVLERQHNVLFDPFDPLVWKVISQYVVVQSYYFLGAAWFRRTHFIKTSLTIVIAFTALVLIALISVRLSLGLYWWNNIGAAIEALDLIYRRLADGALALAQLIHFVVVPAVFWYTVYLRVRETQVSNGV